MGPQFFETPMGKRFFMNQVPQLIQGLFHIGKALEKQNELSEKAIEVNQAILERLKATDATEAPECFDVDFPTATDSTDVNIMAQLNDMEDVFLTNEEYADLRNRVLDYDSCDYNNYIKEQIENIVKERNVPGTDI